LFVCLFVGKQSRFECLLIFPNRKEVKGLIGACLRAIAARTKAGRVIKDHQTEETSTAITHASLIINRKPNHAARIAVNNNPFFLFLSQSPRGMQMCSLTPDLPLNSKLPNSPTMESANSDHINDNDSDSEDLNITTMSSSPSMSPSSSNGGVNDSEAIDSEQTATQQTTKRSSGCILKFSIEKIMEPEKNRVPKESRTRTTRDTVTPYDSAFKKYVPTAASVHQFVANRHQDFLSQYPLLYYPNQLMCAAAQYAALTQQHSNTVSLLSSSSSPNTTLTSLSNLTIQSYQNHAVNSAIKRSSVVSPPSAVHEKTSHHSSASSGSKSIRKAAHSAETPADSKKATVTHHHHHPSSTSGSLSPISPPSAASAANAKAKTFACPECGKIFNAHYNLTRHMPVHTGARPFVCKVSSLLVA